MTSILYTKRLKQFDSKFQSSGHLRDSLSSTGANIIGQSFCSDTTKRIYEPKPSLVGPSPRDRGRFHSKPFPIIEDRPQGLKRLPEPIIVEKRPEKVHYDGYFDHSDSVVALESTMNRKKRVQRNNSNNEQDISRQMGRKKHAVRIDQRNGIGLLNPGDKAVSRAECVTGFFAREKHNHQLPSQKKKLISYKEKQKILAKQQEIESVSGLQDWEASTGNLTIKKKEKPIEQ
eukprot:TRINITY_DN781988_c0_g1_i1.p1 TRINITY_DN781988_c0_g1~~TRINITY_DN781988_c0_g1_i1.p1  ORF type:complete len:231 (-),score=56.33 TRINITY_DN781988_c0_g1_i1:124-816(-)